MSDSEKGREPTDSNLRKLKPAEHPLQRIIFSPPRPLTQRERDVLEFLTSQPFPGSSDLRKQIPFTSVEYGYADEATISLVVDRSASPPASVQARVPVDAVGTEGDWQRCVVILFADGGYLSLLELACSLDYEPPEFPPPSTLRARI